MPTGTGLLGSESALGGCATGSAGAATGGCHLSASQLEGPPEGSPRQAWGNPRLVRPAQQPCHLVLVFSLVLGFRELGFTGRGSHQDLLLQVREEQGVGAGAGLGVGSAAGAGAGAAGAVISGGSGNCSHGRSGGWHEDIGPFSQCCKMRIVRVAGRVHVRIIHCVSLDRSIVKSRETGDLATNSDLI